LTNYTRKLESVKKTLYYTIYFNLLVLRYQKQCCTGTTANEYDTVTFTIKVLSLYNFSVGMHVLRVLDKTAAVFTLQRMHLYRKITEFSGGQ